jgi:predicted O-linked N-acetylglucosamine transferase (SPINDLY family)
MISTWSRILSGAPQSRLLLKSTCLEKAANREAVMERFARHGIGGERLILEGPEEHYKFLEAYARVDVALDTFPYNGGTTTTESLWQGVPVLAMDGDRWVSRTSKSLLRAAGMGDWVVRSKEEYVRRAVDLANSGATGEMLAKMRSEMREKLLGSRACDAAGLCGELEAHFKYAAEANRPPRGAKCCSAAAAKARSGPD